jgi:hypothetical protein
MLSPFLFEEKGITRRRPIWISLEKTGVGNQLAHLKG